MEIFIILLTYAGLALLSILLASHPKALLYPYQLKKVELLPWSGITVLASAMMLMFSDEPLVHVIPKSLVAGAMLLIIFAILKWEGSSFTVGSLLSFFLVCISMAVYDHPLSWVVGIVFALMLARMITKDVSHNDTKSEDHNLKDA